MNSQHFVDTVGTWLKTHALGVTVIVVVTVVVLKVAVVVTRRLVGRLFEGKQDEDSQKLAQTVTRAAHWVVTLTILAVAISVLLDQIGVSMERLFTKALDWLVGNGLVILIILAITFVALKVAGLLATRLVAFLSRAERDVESKKRADTLSQVIRWVLRTGILLLAAVMLLGQLGVQIGPILAAAGVVGLAVGFGAQILVQDIISGFFLLLEDQVRVGDVVQLGDKAGLVEKITLRMVILRDFSGSVHYVRNGKIDVVTNMTKEYSNSVFEIGVAYREDTDEVSTIMAEVGKELQNDSEFKDDILAPLEIVGVDKFADSAVIIKARFKTKPIKQWRVGREFNRRLKKKFDELNIEIPFPHVTLYPGKDKKGDSPTLKLEVQGRERL